MSTGRLGAGDTAIQPTIFDAKGDLLTATAGDTPARIAVGSNGETLVADSSATTGLRWQGDYAAGKNKIINGDFRINQRGFTSINIGYGFDRWSFNTSGATGTYTSQTFTLGAAPVAGYEGTTFARITVTTGNDYCRIEQPIESVRTFAGQTVTLSFWAKGTNPTTAGNLKANIAQVFGSGGSPSSNVILQQTFVLTGSWTRYSFTFNVGSISGKTIGTSGNDYLGVWIGQGDSTSTDTWELDIWGVQLEAGSVATAFQTATGTLAGELAACQRYYFRNTAGSNETIINCAFAGNTTTAQGQVQFPVPMRVAPTSLDSATIKFSNYAGSSFNMTSVAYNQASTVAAQVYGTISGATTGHAGTILGQTTGSYIGLSAEL